MGTLWLSLVPIILHWVQVETLCCPSLEWAIQIFMMALSLDASLSSLMSVELVTMLLQRYVFVSFCMTVLNSFGWNSFLTTCPFCLFEELVLYVEYNFFLLVLCLLDSRIWCQLSTNTSCPQGKFLFNFPCFWIVYALSLGVLRPPMNCEFKRIRWSCPMTQAQSNSFQTSVETSVNYL